MNDSPLVRPIGKADSSAWERMRGALWPSTPHEHAREIARFFSDQRNNPAEVLVACGDSGELIGFLELSFRPFAEGCDSGKIVYIEGWFVEADLRGQGIGRALVTAAEEWGRAQGCAEIASDTEASAAAHKALGFSEIVRVICFRKRL